jgi:hypothetical protein
MNAITPTTARRLAKTASAECSGELWRRLTNANQSWADAVSDLSSDPDLAAKLPALAEQLSRHVEPCGPHRVVEALGPLLTLYGVADKTEGEAKAFWGFYIDALGDLPAEALRAGVAEYVADGRSEFFPKPGPLKAICDRHAMPLRMAANRARRALEHAMAA